MTYNPDLKKRIQEMQSIFDEIHYKLENKNYSPIKKKNLIQNSDKELLQYFQENENVNNEINKFREIKKSMNIEDSIQKNKKEEEVTILKKRNLNNLKLIEKLKYKLKTNNGKDEKIQEIKDDLSVCNDNVDKLIHHFKFITQKYVVMNAKLREYEKQISELKEKNIYIEQEEKITREELLNIKGSLRVLLRIRNKKNNNRGPFKILGTKSLLTENKRDKFQFDHIFEAKSTQENIFRELKPIILSVLDGYNICIFAYGQTGSGKTYTMEGENENLGIIPRAIKSIFMQLKKYEKKKITITQIEIYNDQVKDLIGNKNVEIRYENDELKLNSEKIEITNEAQLFEILKKANEKRSVGETKCNLKSSRSHSLFIVKIEIYGEEIINGTISFIDLAGSERLKESQAEGVRLKETQYINKSLLSLRNVITNIVNNEKYIPFRDSKLTYLLKNYLLNKSRVAMIVNVSSNHEDLNETLCSLKFGQIAKNCIIGPSTQNLERII